MTKHSTVLRCLKNNFIKFPPAYGTILDTEHPLMKIKEPNQGTVVSKWSTYWQSCDVPSKTSGPPSVSRHLSILLEAMNLAMVILALKEPHLAKRSGKDNRTQRQNRKAKQMMNDIISHQKVSLNLRVILLTRVSGLLSHGQPFSRKQKILFDYGVKSRKYSRTRLGLETQGHYLHIATTMQNLYDHGFLYVTKPQLPGSIDY